MKKILIDKGIIEKLREEFKVSKVTIRRALRGEVSNLLHVKIRETTCKRKRERGLFLLRKEREIHCGKKTYRR